MPERSSLNQVIQIGVEVTAGTAVAADKKFQSIGIEPTPNLEIDQFRPMGQKYRALATLSKEWTTANISGRGSYTELVYLLSSVVDTAVIATPGGGTLARTWTFTPDSFDDDAPKTFTVEHGSSVRADSFTHGIVTEFGMSFSRDTVEVSGSMLGQAITDDITLTGAPTDITLVPIHAKDLLVYMDTTAAGLGSTKLTRVLSVDFTLGSRFSPVWVIDDTEASFVAVIESEPDLTMSIMMEADAEGMARLTDVRAGSTKFIRVFAQDATEIDVATNNYEFTLDFAGKVSDTGGFSDADGVYAIEWTFVGVHDATWTKAYEFVLQNALTAL